MRRSGSGKAKSTISRDIKAGKISATRNPDGSVSIDPAELHGVYPATSAATPATGVGDGYWNDSQPRGNGAGTALERENAMLLERLADKDRRLADKDDVIEDLRRRLDAEAEERRKLTMVLTDRRPRKRWWRRLFGRAEKTTGAATVRSNDSQPR
jgi:hypothetical protein